MCLLNSRGEHKDVRAPSKVTQLRKTFNKSNLLAFGLSPFSLFRDLLDLLERGLVLLPGGRDLRGAPTLYFPASPFR